MCYRLVTDHYYSDDNPRTALSLICPGLPTLIRSTLLNTSLCARSGCGRTMRPWRSGWTG